MSNQINELKGRIKLEDENLSDISQTDSEQSR